MHGWLVGWLVSEGGEGGREGRGRTDGRTEGGSRVPRSDSSMSREICERSEPRA